MRLGVLLPTFRTGAADALAVADEAAGAGIDGVFAYDHLWPMGSPERPSLAPFPLLTRVARRHDRLVVAPLVARVGLVGTEHLVEQFLTLEAFAPGRVIATLGSGDRLSAAENDAYGLRVKGADERRALMGEAATMLLATMPVWFGGGAEPTNALARELGATINLWDATPERVREVAVSGDVSWAGPPRRNVAALLDALDDVGATWAIFDPKVEIARLVEWRNTRGLSSFS